MLFFVSLCESIAISSKILKTKLIVEGPWRSIIKLTFPPCVLPASFMCFEIEPDQEKKEGLKFFLSAPFSIKLPLISV